MVSNDVFSGDVLLCVRIHKHIVESCASKTTESIKKRINKYIVNGEIFKKLTSGQSYGCDFSLK